MLIIGAITTYSVKDESYHPTLDQYTTSTDVLKEICENFLNEQNADKMNYSAIRLQVSKSIRCDEFNGECKAFHEFLREAVDVSANNQLVGDAVMRLRKKYENVLRAIEGGKMKLKNGK